MKPAKHAAWRSFHPSITPRTNLSNGSQFGGRPEVLGEDASLIESISLDANSGKFHCVIAPENVLAKLREADLLKT
jgi:hypothetical protein